MAIDKSKMKCNSPKRQISGGKKFVVKACKGGKEKIIRFGDANMTIKKNIPKKAKHGIYESAKSQRFLFKSAIFSGQPKKLGWY